MDHTRCRAVATTIALCASLSSCCTLARLFCGPDRSPWVSEAYDTAEHAALTVREAIRRADSRVIYEALSEDFKRRTNILGSFEAELAWKKIQEDYTGVHMLGYAEMSEPETSPDRRVHYVLTVSGYAFELTFVRQAYWEAHWGEDDEAGQFVENLDGRARVVSDEDEGTSRISIEIPWFPASRLTPDGIVRAGVGHEWKLDEMRRVDG